MREVLMISVFGNHHELRCSEHPIMKM